MDEASMAEGIGQLLRVMRGTISTDPFSSALTLGTGTQPSGTVTTPETQTPTSPVDLNQYKISQEYGVNGHPGVDIAVPVGTPILAATDGTVTQAANDDPNGYGQWVEITAPDGTITRYGHLSGLNVQPGAQIKAGSVIGASGGQAGAEGS